MLRMITALYVGILNKKYYVFTDPERNLECCVCFAKYDILYIAMQI